MTGIYAMFGMPAGSELIFLLVLGVLFFGRNLPGIGRNLGKTIVDFKKGMKGIEDDLEPTTRTESTPLEASRPPQKVQVTAPRFDDSPVAKSPQ